MRGKGLVRACYHCQNETNLPYQFTVAISSALGGVGLEGLPETLRNRLYRIGLERRGNVVSRHQMR